MSLPSSLLRKPAACSAHGGTLPQPSKLLTRGMLARLLNVSTTTVRAWELQRKLPAAQVTAAGWHLYDWSALRTVLREAISRRLVPSLSQAQKRGPALGSHRPTRKIKPTS